jgi:Trk K+ transport system NAD-binding subunit/Kef-type K+ transport system membrane component KefB
MTTTLLALVAFLFVSLASQHIGRFANGVKLPLITGYLLAGAMVGPFILGWISSEAVLSLRVIDDISLGFIAFAAGSELYLKEVRSRFKEIGWITAAQLVFTFAMGVGAVLLVADYVPFMAQMPLSARLAIALMASAILVARSPSSAIAIVAELRARGPHTKTILGVTVVMDAVVILVFATCASISHSLVGSEGFDPWSILAVVLDLVVSVNVGYVTGRILRAVVAAPLAMWLKNTIILCLGWGVFWLSGALKGFSEHHLSLEIALEPLLVCMIGGFVVANHGPTRNQFAEALHQIAPMVYLVFFTLVGSSLALDVLVSLWPIALFLFVVRLLGILAGSVVGGLVAGSQRQHVRVGWMAYVTQAGVGLGLAKEVAGEFTDFGAAFAAMIIAVIVFNQLVGPPLFKFSIKAAGESHLPGTARPDEIRNALILGVDSQSLAVARALKAHNWQVIMADTDQAHIECLAAEDVEERVIDNVDEQCLLPLANSSTDALVAMMEDDAANFQACELAYEKLGIPRLVVRLNDLSWSDKFEEIGARIVEPTSAMVNLLDQMVRVPQMASLLLHRDPEHDVVQVTIADPDIEGLEIRELKLPSSIRIVGITREGHAVVPYGYSVLQRNDEVTMVGEPEELEKIASRWGY